MLDNFDTAYLYKESAYGYRTFAPKKKAPDVIFEKKIDSTYIVVEAVCDTKKNQNYIVSQYLSSVGMENTKTAKAWHASMNAGRTDLRVTSKALDATTFANTNIAKEKDIVKKKTVDAAPELDDYSRKIETKQKRHPCSLGRCTSPYPYARNASEYRCR